MSAMSELATELELKWIEIDGGYEHCSGEYIIHWSQANRVRLFYVHDHLMYWILNGELHTAVARVMAS